LSKERATLKNQVLEVLRARRSLMVGLEDVDVDSWDLDGKIQDDGKQKDEGEGGCSKHNTGLYKVCCY